MFNKKDEVLSIISGELLEKATQILIDALQSTPKSEIDKMTKNLQELIDVNFEEPICPKCKSKTKLIQAKNGDYFWGCLNFPKCRCTKSLLPKEKEIRC